MQTYATPYPSDIDDVRVYNRALSAAEVATLYTRTLSVSRQSASPTKLVTNGLVGYWTFDGANTNWSANTTADSSGNGNTGTLVNMSTTTSPVMGRFGQAMTFNGTSQYASIPYSSSLKPDSITLAAWFYYPTSSPLSTSLQTLVGSWVSGTWGWELDMGGSTSDLIGNFRIHITSDADGVTTTNGSHVFSRGSWQFIAATYDAASGTEHIYANGALVATKTITPAPLLHNTAPLEIGATYDQGVKRYFNGSIDDVRLYNRVLSASEIQQLYNAGAPGKGATIGEAPTILALQSGLVGYWPFDGKSMNWTTNKALDMSGSGNNGTLISMSTTTSPVIGKIGQALSFNGTNQYVISNNLPVGGPLDISSAWSASAWITLPSSPVNNTTYNVVGYTSAGYQQYGVYFFYYNNQWYFRAGDTHGQAQYTVGTVAPGTWLHVTATYDGATIRNYMNGKLVAQGGSTSTYTSSGPKYLQIGTWNGSQFWEGAIDDVRVYNRALSAAEVKQLYNLGR